MFTVYLISMWDIHWLYFSFNEKYPLTESDCAVSKHLSSRALTAVFISGEKVGRIFCCVFAFQRCEMFKRWQARRQALTHTHGPACNIYRMPQSINTSTPLGYVDRVIQDNSRWDVQTIFISAVFCSGAFLVRLQCFSRMNPAIRSLPNLHSMYYLPLRTVIQRNV